MCFFVLIWYSVLYLFFRIIKFEKYNLKGEWWERMRKENLWKELIFSVIQVLVGDVTKFPSIFVG